jgi:Predicted nucleotide-binding protein containing TIR-like domain
MKEAASLMAAQFHEISVKVDDDTTWNFDKMDGEDEGFSMYRTEACTNFEIVYRGNERHYLRVWFNVSPWNSATAISIEMPSRGEVERVFDIFESHLQASSIPQPLLDKRKNAALRIFIGHGRSPLWRDLKDHLHDKHGYDVEAFESAARGGLAVTDIIDQMGEDAAFAILVMTGENESAQGTMHARENVIHETGLFQGVLGLRKVVVLLEEGCEEFSNRAGVQYLPFAKGNIKETFGEVVATIKREFG